MIEGKIAFRVLYMPLAYPQSLATLSPVESVALSCASTHALCVPIMAPSGSSSFKCERGCEANQRLGHPRGLGQIGPFELD